MKFLYLFGMIFAFMNSRRVNKRWTFMYKILVKVGAGKKKSQPIALIFSILCAYASSEQELCGTRHTGRVGKKWATAYPT